MTKRWSGLVLGLVGGVAVLALRAAISIARRRRHAANHVPGTADENEVFQASISQEA